MVEASSPGRDGMLAEAEELRRAGRYGEGIDLVARVLHDAPHDALAHFRLGNLYLDQGELASAEREYVAATELRPDYASALNNLAAVYRRQRRTRLFVTTYKKAQRAAARPSKSDTAHPRDPSARRRIWGTALLFLLVTVAALVAWELLRERPEANGEVRSTASASATARRAVAAAFASRINGSRLEG